MAHQTLATPSRTPVDSPAPGRKRRPLRNNPWSRRVSDPRGVDWHVREVRSDAGRALLFQCAVAGVRSEIHAVHRGLASFSDEDLLAFLPASDD